jgi:hypothetical protein
LAAAVAVAKAAADFLEETLVDLVVVEEILVELELQVKDILVVLALVVTGPLVEAVVHHKQGQMHQDLLLQLAWQVKVEMVLHQISQEVQYIVLEAAVVWTLHRQELDLGDWVAAEQEVLEVDQQ